MTALQACDHPSTTIAHDAAGDDVPDPGALLASLDGLPHMAILLTADGAVMWTNAFVSRRFPAACPPANVAGLGWFDSRVALRKALAAADPGQSVPVGGAARGADGTIVSDMVLSPLDTAGGERLLLLFGVDVTAQRRNQERQEVVSREMAHRSRNLFSVIQAITGQTFARDEPTDRIRDILMGRLQALSRCHGALVDADWTGVNLRTIARQEVAPFSDRVTIDGPDIALEASAGQAMALVLHELGTNAAKHGALSTPEGRVAVMWLRGGNGLVFRWTESGGPPVAPPAREGFGRMLIGRIVEQELGVAPAIEFHRNGVRYEATIPGDRIVA